LLRKDIKYLSKLKIPTFQNIQTMFLLWITSYINAYIL